MRKSNLLLYILILSTFYFTNLFAQKKSSGLKKTDLLSIGVISYPSDIEERSDIPFALLVDNQYKKALGDTVDYEKFRPSLIFFEKGYDVIKYNESKKNYAYITVNVLHGKYQFPKVITDEQRSILSSNIKQTVEDNIKETQFKITKWNPVEFQKISGLAAITSSYEQTLDNKSKTIITNTNLYDSDIQVQIVLSAPQKEYKKWLAYYNQMINTFARKVNIADILTFEYPTNIRNRKDIPFKYLVDKEFRQILGDSIDYESFAPSLLLLDQSFTIQDSLNIVPFGNITVNVLPRNENKQFNKDSFRITDFEAQTKKEIDENLAQTKYNITNWHPFSLADISDIPLIRYSYDQEKDGKSTKVSSATIITKDAEIQIGMSCPIGDIENWQQAYEALLSSLTRIVTLGKTGTILYPNEIEERSDIPFVKLVDEESKRILGDSIDYEKFRPYLLFLDKDFNENDPAQLKSFNSITINTTQGDFLEINNSDSISNNKVESIIKMTEEKNLQNTSYRINKWDDFEFKQLPKNIRKISYSFIQNKDNSESKYICITYFYTNSTQTKVTLTCNVADYSRWQPIYNNLVNSYRAIGLR